MKAIIVKSTQETDKNGRAFSKIIVKLGMEMPSKSVNTGFGVKTVPGKRWNSFCTLLLMGETALTDEQLPGDGDTMDLPIRDSYTYSKYEYKNSAGEDRFKITLKCDKNPKGWDETLATYLTDFDVAYEPA